MSCNHNLLQLQYVWNKNAVDVKFYRCSQCGLIFQLIDNKPLVNPKEAGNRLEVSEPQKETKEKWKGDIMKFGRITKKTLLIMALVSLIISGVAYGIVYWTSPQVKRVIRIEGLDAYAIDVTAFANYGNKVVPTSIADNYADVRADSFLVAVKDINIDKDMLMEIKVTGAPPGCSITAYMVWACYHMDIVKNKARISFYDDSGVPANAYDEEGGYQTYDWSKGRAISVDGSTTILNGDIHKATYDETLPEWAKSGDITWDKCNGLWLRFAFDLSGVTGFGEWNLLITVRLGEV